MMSNMSDSPSETITDSDVLLSTRFVTVDTVPAATPEGLEYRHTRVTSASPMGAVVVPVCRHRGLLHVCLVTQYRPVLGAESVEFPRGSTADLTQEEAARELAEETGLGRPSSARLLGTLRPDTGLLSTTVGVWAAGVSVEEMEASRGHVEAGSGVRPQWMLHADALEMAANGKITCGMTLAALALIRPHEGTLAC